MPYYTVPVTRKFVEVTTEETTVLVTAESPEAALAKCNAWSEDLYDDDDFRWRETDHEDDSDHSFGEPNVSTDRGPGTCID